MRKYLAVLGTAGLVVALCGVAVLAPVRHASGRTVPILLKATAPASPLFVDGVTLFAGFADRLDSDGDGWSGLITNVNGECVNPIFQPVQISEV